MIEKNLKTLLWRGLTLKDELGRERRNSSLWLAYRQAMVTTKQNTSR